MPAWVRSGLFLFAVVAALVTFAAIPYLDRFVAEFVRSSGVEGAWIFTAGTTFFDTVSGKTVYKFLPGIALIVVGVPMLLHEHARRHGAALLFVGASHVLSTLLCGVSKNVFGRLRPYELLESGAWDQVWFAGGSSFPSGHAGFYFGLFLPLACLFPRWRGPLLVIPFFIAIARVNENAHFISDVTASMTVAALMTLVLARVLQRWLPRSAKRWPA